MIISKIITEEYIYFNLHAEEVITSNFVDDNNRGIFCDRLLIPTIKRIIDNIKQSKEVINIVFDFNNIIACQENLNKTIIDLKNDGYKILLINISEELCKNLNFNSIRNPKNILADSIFLRFYLFEDTEDLFTKVIVNPFDLFWNEFQRIIKKYIEPHNKPHTSSFVYLTSFVDMKRFMSYEKEFLLYSLYRLALKIRKRWTLDLKKDPILICQSMNSSYIVSILSTLLKLDILIFDKIGPVNKLYNRLDNNISSKRKYIIVSDLVCLGTEIKITKNLIQFIGGKCLGNVSLIKTETLKKSDIKNENATIAVFSIRKENNKELNYNITTNLEPLLDEK